MLPKILLLFFLNWLDAVLTVLWVRINLATEGNALMARLMQYGDLSFIAVKVGIGLAAALILYRYASNPLAQRGLKLALGVYCVLMLVHAATGISALEWFFTATPATVLH